MKIHIFKDKRSALMVRLLCVCILFAGLFGCFNRGVYVRSLLDGGNVTAKAERMQAHGGTPYTSINFGHESYSLNVTGAIKAQSVTSVGDLSKIEVVGYKCVDENTDSLVFLRGKAVYDILRQRFSGEIIVRIKTNPLESGPSCNRVDIYAITNGGQ